jgi:hypothetical protein
MTQTILEKDIQIICIKATSFPAGVMQAHDKLHALVPKNKDRRYFGLSRPEGNAGIVYKAATEELEPGEAKKLNCESLIIPKGSYNSILITDFMKDVQSIGKAFEKLLHQPNIDPQGYCVEEYLNEKDVLCMVRMRS